MRTGKHIGLLVRRLTIDEILVLESIEKSIEKFLYVPMDLLAQKTNFSNKKLKEVLDRLNEDKMVSFSKKQYLGVKITSKGLDVLALRKLVDRDMLYGLGKELGVGKESKVYEGKVLGNKEAAVKISRVGKNAFKKVKRYRSFKKGRGGYWWYFAAIESTNREFDALYRLYGIGASVPRPITKEKHILVTDKINGEMLVDVYWKLNNPNEIFDLIIEEIKKWFTEVDIVHGDLSQYNILLDERNRLTFIDWPQWVSKDHPMYEAYLRRDLEKVADFFKRKFSLEINVEEKLNYIISM